MRALDAQQKQIAVLQDKVPNDMITTNARRVDPLSPDGLAAAGMTTAQQKLLRDLLTEYTSRMVDDIAEERVRRINAPVSTKCRLPGLAPTRCTSPITTACRARHSSSSSTTCRSSANHIHSVWRDFNGDFGEDVLKSHYKSAHNQ